MARSTMLQRLLATGASLALAALPCALPLTAHPAVAAPSSAAVCATNRLGFVLDGRAGGTAGSHYLHLRLKNYGSSACTLRGYPGVSAVARNGRQLGHAATHDTRYRVRTLTLQPHESAITLVRVTNVDNLPRSSCRPVSGYGLRVFPPGNTRSVILKFRQQVCSKRTARYLTVQAVRRG